MLTRKEIYLKIKNMPPQQALDNYYENYKNLPKQGSLEWNAGRKIGGSKAAGILGIGSNNTKITVAKDLLGLNTFTGSLATYWGTVFEEVAKQYLLNYIKIYEFGSIPGFEDITSYSPDGIFIATAELIKKFKLPGEILNQIVLLEIKCPFRRKISEIPDYYIPQIQLGMNTIYVTKYCLFSEFAFRVCSLCDFNFSSSTSLIFENNSMYSVPDIIGFIGFYDNGIDCEIQDIINININIEWEPTHNILELINIIETTYPAALYIEKYIIALKYFNKNLVNDYFGYKYADFDFIDFGASKNFIYKSSRLSNELLFKYFAQQVTENNIFISKQISNSGTDACYKHLEQQINEFIKNAGSKKILGVLPYKLMYNKNTIVNKVNYIPEIKKLVEFGKKINIIRELPKDQWENEIYKL